MNLERPDDDIDLEIKKMELAGHLGDGVLTTSMLIEKFGFSFVKSFVEGFLNIPKHNNVLHLTNKVKIVLDDLKKIKPIEEYPELWI